MHTSHISATLYTAVTGKQWWATFHPSLFWDGGKEATADGRAHARSLVYNGICHDRGLPAKLDLDTAAKHMADAGSVHRVASSLLVVQHNQQT
jgi:hypothetical protein